MGKLLVAYFSASGVTKKKAEMIAEITKADIYEIAPKVYTQRTISTGWIKNQEVVSK